MKLLEINAHAPLATWRGYPGARLKLFCGACGWSKTYDPERIAARLRARKWGGIMTPVASVATHIHWPCPGCNRMRWRTVLVAP